MFGALPAPTPGSAAPPFCLPDQHDRPVKLVDFRGKKRVVLTFYAEDDTPGSNTALAAFEAARSRFEALGAQILGISHNDVRSHARIAAKLGLKFPLLADPQGEAARLYGAKTLLPFFARRSYVIDGKGLLRLAHRGMPKVEALLTFLEGLTGDLPNR
ncbi:MAG TPA: peroxiredoxin [Oscillatoriaceae cyanobacterium]